MAETKIEKSIAEALHKQTVYIISAMLAIVAAVAAIVHFWK